MNQYPLLPPSGPTNHFATMNNLGGGGANTVHDNSFTTMTGVMRASKESFNGPMFQSVRDSMPKPSQEFNTPTAGIEKDESIISASLQGGEVVRNETGPNMPPLNPKTNFRY